MFDEGVFDDSGKATPFCRRMPHSCPAATLLQDTSKTMSAGVGGGDGVRLMEDEDDDDMMGLQPTCLLSPSYSDSGSSAGPLMSTQHQFLQYG